MPQTYNIILPNRSPSPDSTSFSSSSSITPTTPPPPRHERRISITPIYIPPPPPAPKRRPVPPSPPGLRSDLLKPRTKRRSSPRRRNSITNALRSSSDSIYTLRPLHEHSTYSGSHSMQCSRSKSKSRKNARRRSTNFLVSKSRGGGMGITLTPPLHHHHSDHHDDSDHDLDHRNDTSSKMIMSVREHELKAQRFRAHSQGEKRRASDPNKLMPPNTQQIKNRVSTLKLTTYSVVFRSKVLGLELHPLTVKAKNKNKNNNTGALVTWCHNAFAGDNVVINSMVVGVGDRLVIEEDHEEIIELIRNSSRPLRITFHCHNAFDSESMSTWRDRTGKIRFRCR